MADINLNGDSPGIAKLVGGLIDDMQRLVRQEAALARRGLEEEWNKTKEGAMLVGAACALLAPVGVLFGFMLVTLLEKLVLPGQEWACFGIVSLLFVVVGGVLFYLGRTRLEQVQLVPQDSVDSIKQDVQAVADAVTTDRPAAAALVKR